jgi:hypothetical protein
MNAITAELNREYRRLKGEWLNGQCSTRRLEMIEARLRAARDAAICPQCGGHVTDCPEGQADVPVVNIHPLRNEAPLVVRMSAPFRSCDRCEWLVQTR